MSKETSCPNVALWDELSVTDPKYTKSFQRAGGFKGTAQNPTYAIRKMTERFGACGMGWGYGKPEFTLHNAGDAGVLVYSTLQLWYVLDGKRYETWGIGGDTVVTKTKNGLVADDEAFKKATTDALTNAMKSIGVGADIHLGMYDDSKYLNGLTERFAEKPKPENEPDTIIENLEKAETLDALTSTRKLYAKDIAICKAHYPDDYTKIVDAGVKRKADIEAAIKKQADAIVKQEHSRLGQRAKQVDNYMQTHKPIENVINDSIPY